MGQLQIYRRGHLLGIRVHPICSGDLHVRQLQVQPTSVHVDISGVYHRIDVLHLRDHLVLSLQIPLDHWHVCQDYLTLQRAQFQERLPKISSGALVYQLSVRTWLRFVNISELCDICGLILEHQKPIFTQGEAHEVVLYWVVLDHCADSSLVCSIHQAEWKQHRLWKQQPLSLLEQTQAQYSGLD